MVDALVSGASAARRAGSSPVLGTQTTLKHSGCSAVRLAHLLWEQGVVGSNPATPTKYKGNLLESGVLDEWLSQRSAKPSTAVRIRQTPLVNAGLREEGSLGEWLKPPVC